MAAPTAQGQTREQRAAARAERRRTRSVAFHAGRVRTAHSGWGRLIAALNYAQAVGKRLNDAGRTELARTITAAADAANTQESPR